MMIYLPVVFPNFQNEWVTDPLKAIELRFLESTNSERKVISKVFLPADRTNVGDALDGITPSASIALALFSSPDISVFGSGSLASRIFLSPISCAASPPPNVYQLLLTEWEVLAIKKFLKMVGIGEDSVALFTDLDPADPYLRMFFSVGNYICPVSHQCSAQVNMHSPGELPTDDPLRTQPLNDMLAGVIVGKNKWKIARICREAFSPAKGPLLLSTSSFENWSIPPLIRKMYGANVFYCFPSTDERANGFMKRFCSANEYFPPINALLTYDACSIAIKSLLEAGPNHEGLSSYLNTHQHDSMVFGRIGFGNGLPYAARSNAGDAFEIKYVDEKGEFVKGSLLSH